MPWVSTAFSLSADPSKSLNSSLNRRRSGGAEPGPGRRVRAGVRYCPSKVGGLVALDVDASTRPCSRTLTQVSRVKNEIESQANSRAQPSGGRRGRPKKKSTEKRRHRRYTSLNDHELALLERNRGEILESDFLRLVATRGRRPTLPVPRINREEYVRLYQLEQWLRRTVSQVERAHGRLGNEGEALREALEETRQEVVRLRRALTGVAP